MERFVLEHFCDELNIENVIFKNDNVLLGDLLPHDKLFGILLPVDELETLLCLAEFPVVSAG